MTTTNAFERQPTKLDYASPTQFKFSIAKLPKVEFFVSTVNIPGIQLGSGTQKTPLLDMPYPGDKLTYGKLGNEYVAASIPMNVWEMWCKETNNAIKKDKKFEFTPLPIRPDKSK